jgi:hypothetical protein
LRNGCRPRPDLLTGQQVALDGKTVRHSRDRQPNAITDIPEVPDLGGPTDIIDAIGSQKTPYPVAAGRFMC